MPRIIALPIGTIAIHAPNYPASDPRAPPHVFDGDTFFVGGQKWRLYGWDAPPVGPIGSVLTRNSGEHPHCTKELELGRAAKRFAAELIADAASRGAVHVEILNLKDKHQRWLVRILIDGEELGLRLYERGLSDRYDGNGPKWGFCDCHERREAFDTALARYREAQDELRERRRSKRKQAR